jgi:uncharacterized membrane protein
MFMIDDKNNKYLRIFGMQYILTLLSIGLNKMYIVFTKIKVSLLTLSHSDSLSISSLRVLTKYSSFHANKKH